MFYFLLHGLSSFCPFIFTLYVFLGLGRVSCRQHIYRSCFCINSVSLYILVGAFSPFTFKVIIKWHPTPVLSPGKSHGQRSLVGCSPWCREESDTTERLHFSLSCIGEGNGNPLQCSCLENPRDGGAWWAARCLWGRTESDTTEAT